MNVKTAGVHVGAAAPVVGGTTEFSIHLIPNKYEPNIANMAKTLNPRSQSGLEGINTGLL